MHNIKRMGLLLGCLVIGQTSLAADGQQLAGRCASCHGANGVSTNPVYPNLAGQKAPYLLKQMRDFQSGKRADPVMSAMLKGMTEADMDALANYYSNMK